MKTINITDIKLIEVNFSEDPLTMAVLYALTDTNGKEYEKKRKVVLGSDMTATQRTTIQNILDKIKEKIVAHEEI